MIITILAFHRNNIAFVNQNSPWTWWEINNTEFEPVGTY